MRNPLLRVLFSLVLVAIVIYIVWSHKTAATKRPATSNKPFLSTAPSSEGSNRFAWVPKVPGTELENITTRQSHESLSYGFRFHTTQDPSQALSYYETQLRPAGFTVVKNLGAKNVGGALHAEDSGRKRVLDVNAAQTPTGTEVGVSAVEQ